MTLDAIADALRQNIKDNRLSLDSALLNLDSFTTLLSLLETDGFNLELNGSNIAPQGRTLKLDGRATLLGTPAEVQLLFEEADGQKVNSMLGVRLASLALPALTQFGLVPTDRLDPAKFPSNAFTDVSLSVKSKERTLTIVVPDSSFDWTLSDELNLSLKNIGFSLTRSLTADAAKAQKDVRFSISGRMNAGSTPLDIKVELPTNPLSPNQWGLMLAAKSSFASGLSDISALLSGGQGELNLPPGLSELASFSLDNLRINFNPAARSVNSVSLRLSSSEPWEMVPSVSVEEVGIGLFVMQPSSSKRSVTTEIFGKIKFGEQSKLAIKMSVPAGGSDWFLTLTEPLSLSGLAELSNVPGGLDTGSLQLPPELSNATLWLNRFELDFNPKRRSVARLAVALSSEIQWNVISNLSIGKPAVSFEIVNPFDTAKRAVKGGMGGMITVGEASFFVGASRADVASGWQMSGGLNPGQSIRLTEIARDMLDGATLPDELPDLEFTNLALSITPATGALAFKGKATAKWDLPFGVSGLAVSTVEIDLQKAAATGTGAQRVAGAVSCSLKLNGEGAVAVAEGLVFKKLSLSFNLVNRSSWTLAGSITASIFDADYTLSASLEETTAARRISLSATTTATTLVSFDGVGSLSGKSVTINIAKQRQTGTAANTSTTTAANTSTSTAVNPPASADASAPAAGGAGVSMNAASPYTWDVTIAGGLVVTGMLNVEGTLQLFKQADRAGLVFRAQNAEARIPLPIPQHPAEFHFGLQRISIVRSQTASGASSWAFDAAADVWFTGLPASIQNLLAQKTTGQLKVDASGVQVSVNRLLQPLEINVPDAQAGSLTIELGMMALDASNLLLVVKGGTLSLTLDFGVGLPQKLNNLFGKRPDGTPSTRLFNTYIRGNANSITRFRVGINTTDGVNIQMVTSPFVAARLVTEGLDAWWYVDLGDFGKIKLLVPVFNYRGDSFVARGGFQQVEPLMIPLAPLRALLSAVGLGAASASLPRGIPLQDLDIYDTQSGRFKFQQFIETLETLGGFRLPAEAREALSAIESRLDALPDRFKSYLDIEIPQQFEFNISITPDGGARGKIWVTGDKPLKFIYPTMGPLGPVMTGIELYSISFGEMLGGSLMLLNIDVRVDSYDLLLLVATLALPLDKLPILPDTRSLTRRLVVENLFMVIIYQTGIPIPVPLFFDQLGIEYLGLEGLELQTHWGFPKPHLNATDAARIFKDFENFFTQRDHLLDASTPPEGLDLKLVIGPNFVKLPEYLGGKSLGSRDETIIVSAYSNLAHLLNALKTLSLNELIQALPLEKRVGHEQVSFASMTLVADWLITTPKEFREISYRQLKIAEGEVGGILQVLPADPNRDEQGLIIFLKGGWSIAGAASLGVTFGLVGTARGFGTGLRVAGSINDLLEVEMGGTVVIDTKGTDVFSLRGTSRLRIFDDDVFTGDLQITENRFAISGRLDLFPRSQIIRITGELAGRISNQEFYIGGAASVTVGGFFVLAHASAEITHNGFKVSGTWLNQTATFSALKVGNGLQLKATLSQVSVGNAFRLTDSTGTSGPIAILELKGDTPNVYISGRIAVLGISAGGTVSFSDAGFSFTVEGQIFNLFQATLVARGSNLLNGEGFYVKATLRNDLFAYLKEQASRAINESASGAVRQLSDAQKSVDAAQRNVNDINRQIDDMRRTVQQERARDQERLNAAQREVDRAQKSVDDLDRQVDDMRRTVQNERNRDQKNLRDAQAAVQDAQNKVNSLQRQIDDANARIKQLKRDIDNKKKWYDKQPWYKQSYAWTELGAYTTAKGAEIAAQYTAIGSLETAKATANGVLELAKQTVRGIEQASKTFPIDADPRVAALLTARGTATAALNLAKGTLSTIQSGIKLIPIDADPRVAALITGRETATAALSLANQTLEGLKVSLGALAQVGDYIVKNGLGDLLDVRAASFEATLDAAQGGNVNLSADLVFMGTPRSVRFDFNFQNPLQGAQNLAQVLMPK